MAVAQDTRVYFTFCKSEENANALAVEFSNAFPVHIDFNVEGDLARLDSLIASIEISALVNNALGSMQLKHFHQGGSERFASSFLENVLPTIRITQESIRAFRKQKFGRIVTVLSAYRMGRPPVGMSEYVANKAYLAAMSKSWAEENGRFNISSNTVSPSMMNTGLIKDLDERQVEAAELANPLGRLVSVEEVADVIAGLLDSTAQINGIDIPITGGERVI